MAELLAKEALSLLQQVPKDEWNTRHIEALDRSSYIVAMIARQMGRFREAEGLLQSSLDRYKEIRKKNNKGSQYLKTAYELIWLHIETGNYAKAEALVMEAIHIAEHNLYSSTDVGQLKSRQRNTIFLHSALADLYEATGRRIESEHVTMQVLQMMNSAQAETVPEEIHLECLDSLRRNAESFIAQGGKHHGSIRE